MDWLPIETAPKDGTRIDLWVKRSDGKAFRVADAFWKTPWGPHDREYVGWVGNDDEGEWLFLTDNRDFSPTHWMPLPPPPAQ